MMPHRAFVGIGTNLGDRSENLARAVSSLRELGTIVRLSSSYRTAPWGNREQAWYLNAVALLETQLAPRELLDRLHAIEDAMGRVRPQRWGPRIIDLDLLTYDDLRLDAPDLRLPHPHLHERAFVLVPLAEIDVRFQELRDSLHVSELAGVARVERESVVEMSEEPGSVSERVRGLARFLDQTDALRVRIERGDDDVVEVEAAAQLAQRSARSGKRTASEATAQRIDTIRADLVGIFHHSRPASAQGDAFRGDRELGYIEALGIRTPVHSMGSGRLVSVAVADGTPVEYGQPLFLIARR